MNQLLHDQRFWSGLVGLVVLIVASLHPDSEDSLNEDGREPAKAEILASIERGLRQALDGKGTAAREWLASLDKKQ